MKENMADTKGQSKSEMTASPLSGVAFSEPLGAGLGEQIGDRSAYQSSRCCISALCRAPTLEGDGRCGADTLGTRKARTIQPAMLVPLCFYVSCARGRMPDCTDSKNCNTKVEHPV